LGLLTLILLTILILLTETGIRYLWKKRDLYSIRKTTRNNILLFVACFLGITILCGNSINDKILEGIKAQIIDTDPIYSLFTSGSTGVPKGYIINHRSVIDFCEAMTKTFHLSSEDIYSNQSPLYFDLSIADIYCNIKNGSTVHLIPQNLFMFPVKVIDFLNEHHINFIFWVPSALVLTSQALEKVQPKYLKKV